MNKKNNDPTMKGFEELYESYLSDDEYAKASRLDKETRDLDQYELQHFLEQENNRLGSIENFLTKKIPAKTNFSQTEKLIKLQEDRKQVVLEQLVPTISKLSSHFQHNMAQLFNAHFS